MRIAIQGIRGSFHDLAARRYFGEKGFGLSVRGSAADIRLLECLSFKDVFEAVERGEADYGMIAIENTIA